MTYEATLLVFGILLLLIGLVGKVKAKELEIGTSSTTARAVIGTIGVALIVVSLVIVKPSIFSPADPGSTTSTAGPTTSVVPAPLNVFNRESRRCLEVAEVRPGGRVVIDFCGTPQERPYQYWEWKGSQLYNAQSQRCLDVAEDRPGGQAVIDSCGTPQERPYQYWEWKGSQLYNAQSQRCLDVAEDRPGGRVVIDSCGTPQERPYQYWEWNEKPHSQ